MVEVWLGSVVGSVSLSLAMVGVGVATVGEVVAIVVYVCRLVGSWDGFLSCFRLDVTWMFEFLAGLVDHDARACNRPTARLVKPRIDRMTW